jgi:phage terminase small subunit
MRNKLTLKQEKFVAEVVRTGNATKAAKKAYEIESTDPDNVARSMGSENLAKPAIQKALKPFIDRLSVHREKVLKRMDETVDEAEYSDLTRSLDTTTKTIQLLSGGATERTIVIEVPKEIAEKRGLNGTDDKPEVNS